MENVAVAVGAAAAAVLLAWTWLRLLGGVGIAPLFLRGDAALTVDALPYRLAPVPILLATGVSEDLPQ